MAYLWAVLSRAYEVGTVALMVGCAPESGTVTDRLGPSPGD
jgi:hypothetical protein